MFVRDKVKWYEVACKLQCGKRSVVSVGNVKHMHLHLHFLTGQVQVVQVASCGSGLSESEGKERI